MTHEIKRIIAAYSSAKIQGEKCVLATVVALEGSSYRRPGVRMLLMEGGKRVGAVSGGCVENEVERQASSVFEDGIQKMMTYDGRYRLGCEGILYILLEPFQPQKAFLEAFEKAVQKRVDIQVRCHYYKEEAAHHGLGSIFFMNGNAFKLRGLHDPNAHSLRFEQSLKPCQRLVIIGAEHDAVILVAAAAQLGWEVIVVADSKEEKSIDDFSGAIQLRCEEPETLDIPIDSETAVVIMTHSYAKDFRFLLALKEKTPVYLGLLGPSRRREKLFHELIEKHPEISTDFLDNIHGPAGLDIGAETPEEIALAIMAELLADIRGKNANQLKYKQGNIHERGI